MIEDFNFYRLDLSSDIKPFDCDAPILNKFLFERAKDYLRELLSVTYVLESDEETVAYFSVFNDSIRKADTSGNRYKMRVMGLIPYGVHYDSQPAVKIGPFAVNRNLQGRGIGTELMDFIKGFFIDANSTGCRFITVDALNNERTIRFYQRNGFDFLDLQDEHDESRVMFFDLITYAPH